MSRKLMMSRRCTNPKCDKHHIALQGAAKYCPACGGETFPIPVYPFYIYASKTGFLWVAGAILFVFVVLPGIKAISSNVTQGRMERAAQVESLPEFWKTLYQPFSS